MRPRCSVSSGRYIKQQSMGTTYTTASSSSPWSRTCKTIGVWNSLTWAVVSVPLLTRHGYISGPLVDNTFYHSQVNAELKMQHMFLSCPVHAPLPGLMLLLGGVHHQQLFGYTVILLTCFLHRRLQLHIKTAETARQQRFTLWIHRCGSHSQCLGACQGKSPRSPKRRDLLSASYPVRYT
jgi:hypothetical protein